MWRTLRPEIHLRPEGAREPGSVRVLAAVPGRLQLVSDHEPPDLLALPRAGVASLPEVDAGIHAGVLASATAFDSDSKERVMALVGRGVRGAGRGTAGALKVRVKAMRSVPKNWRSTSAAAPVAEGRAQG